MDISIFGLGYVGCVTAACLANDGHRVIGVELNREKVALIKEGRSPIREPGLEVLISKAVSAGRLIASTDATSAICDTDLSLICVGTPSRKNGDQDLSYIRRVGKEIGVGLRALEKYHLVVVRSTLLPGTTEKVILPLLEQVSGKRVGPDFGLAHNPEFLREGNAIDDFHSPPRTVIGQWDEKSGDSLVALYQEVDAPLIRTSLRMAEIVKYVDNAFHALKVVFANEIGALSRAHELDSHQLMDIFCLDTKLNISPAYLKPGSAFGGSCLPKDLRALTRWARDTDVAVPLLEAVLASNEFHKKRALALVQETGKKNIGVLGMTFKPGTDDLRESPTVELVESLIGKGYSVRIYDPDVELSSLVGANKAHIEREIPHIASLMVPTLPGVLSEAEVVVLTSGNDEFRRVPSILNDEQILVDLVRVLEHPDGLAGRYFGIGW